MKAPVAAAYLRHLVVERYHLLRRSLVGGKDAWCDERARCGGAGRVEILQPERVDQRGEV